MQEKAAKKYPLGGRVEAKICDHLECDLEGVHRAPKTRDDMRDYFWFCLEHVRDYNAHWNFCEGMDQSDMDAMIKTDLCWGRPTWPLGNAGAESPTSKADDGRRASFTGRIYDPFDVYEEATSHSSREKKEKQEALRNHPEMAAYLTLGFDYPADEKEVKIRYKSLAKDLHPDLNQGNESKKSTASLQAEERLKEVNAAYSQLKKTFS